MSTRVTNWLEDDLDGSSADRTVTFALDGDQYEIDLSAQNCKDLFNLLDPFIQAARPVPTARTAKLRRRTTASGSAAQLPPPPQAVRDWARSNGVTVADRGRIPTSVLDQYAAAHGG